MVPTREEAFQLLKQYNESEALIHLALAVEGTMRYFARILNEDEEKWGIIGLLHDLDYEKYSEQHCVKVVEIMSAYEIDEENIQAVVSHGYGICSDVAPVHIMEKVLYSIEELTGLINAAALMRPSKSVMDLKYKSFNKKYKTNSFAAGVDRSVIEKGTQMLNMELKDIMEHTNLAMREVADSIGLGGTNV